MNTINVLVDQMVESSLECYAQMAARRSSEQFYQPIYAPQPPLAYSVELATAIHNKPHGIIELASPLSD